MRMMPTRYAFPRPARVKAKAASKIEHLSAPIQGLSLSSKLSTTDQLIAVGLRNVIVEEDRVTSRVGSKLLMTHADADPIETLIPYYGFPETMVAATNGKLASVPTGTTLKTGFLGNDWSWTAFSNLSAEDYTVMVNGFDGVWAWSGLIDPLGFVKQAVTAPAGASHIIPDNFNIVLAHHQRLWFADRSNLSVYYLPLQVMAGEVIELPLNVLFKRGGAIRALYQWSLEGGATPYDQLVIFTTNGECAIFSGFDPDDTLGNFGLVGVFRFDSPMSKHSVVNYGGELYVMISTGLVPMSTMMRAESEQLGKSDKNVFSLFRDRAYSNRNTPGWQVLVNHSSGHLICNMPGTTAGVYDQVVRFMPNPIWAEWGDLRSRCWQWLGNVLYFGTDTGQVYEMQPGLLSDNGLPINIDVMWGWSEYRTSAQKHFKMVKPIFETDGNPRPFVQMMVDYDYSKPVSQPEITYGTEGAIWDLADWDTSDWAQGARQVSFWTGAAALGRVGAPRVTCAVLGCTLAITGLDVLYEPGAAI